MSRPPTRGDTLMMAGFIVLIVVVGVSVLGGIAWLGVTR